MSVTPSLTPSEKRSIRLFLDRFQTSSQPTASNMTMLYGLSALLSSHGLKHISQIDSLDNITSDQRKQVISSLTHHQPNKYWNGRPDVSKRPPLPTSSKNYSRKTVVKRYPFADGSSVSRVVRSGLPVPLKLSNESIYKCMNDYGVRPLITLNDKVKGKVVGEGFREFNFTVLGMKKSDVKEALRWVGAIGEEMGGRVTQLVKRVEGGGKEHFKFEEWLDLVEEAVEADVRDKEEETEDFFGASEAPQQQQPQYQQEGGDEAELPQPPQASTKPKRSLLVGGNVIPWDGVGTRRTASMPENPSNFQQKLNKSSSDSSVSSSVKRAFRQKTKAQRWEIDRNFALQRRSKIQASRDAENVQFYGRAQLGGMRSNKEPKDNVGRKHLRGIIREGREKKRNSNKDKSDSVETTDLEIESGRGTPIRSMWVSKRSSSAGDAVRNAENFLKTNLAVDAGGEPSETSTDASFRNRLNELTDPNLESNVVKGRKDEPRRTSRPPLSGWIGDYSSDTSFRRPGGWTKPSAESSRDTSSASGGSSWNFTKIVDKTASSGSDLNLSKGSSSKISNVGGSNSGSSVSSSEIYTRDALAMASPGSEGTGGSKTPELSPDSNA
ncbi:hypothetical protein TrVE_jg7848 [Triparma verrucosa]|uniref:Uncharacterized protein n=1 Tax=Triparma verrucosa TaxID=1606542 RepID=A0A9W7BUZ3_9STRA|nr:hypothetical protein TrVE_jg7848 [Triparma verrucosa]